MFGPIIQSDDPVPSAIELLGVAQFTGKPIPFFMPIQHPSDDVLTGKEWQVVFHFRDIQSEEMKDMALSTVKHFSTMKAPQAKK